MAGIRNYVDGPFGQLHYAEEGQGPPIVLIHMAGFNHQQYQAALPLLAKAGFRAIAIDLPGFGMSAAPASPPSVRDYAQATRALMDALHLDRAIVVGSHLGAQVATELAVRFEESVEKVILVGPLPTTAEEREENQKQVEAEKNATVKHDGSHLHEIWQYTMSFFQGVSDIEAFERIIVCQLAAGDRNWYGHNAVFSYDHAETLARLKQDCLVLTNTGDIAHFFSLRARQDYPQFGYVELEGGTALIVDEQPEAWCNAVIEFSKAG